MQNSPSLTLRILCHSSVRRILLFRGEADFKLAQTLISFLRTGSCTIRPVIVSQS